MAMAMPKRFAKFVGFKKASHGRRVGPWVGPWVGCVFLTGVSCLHLARKRLKRKDLWQRHAETTSWLVV